MQLDNFLGAFDYAAMQVCLDRFLDVSLKMPSRAITRLATSA